MNDSALFRRLLDGDEAAFGEIYENCHRPLFRFALAMADSRELAEEAVQEAFLQLIRRTARYDPGRGTLLSFLFGVTRNMLWKLAGRQREHVPLDEDAPVEIPAAPLLAGLERRERVEAVRRAVRALPEHYREAVVLCELEELKYEEAALALGCPVGTVRSRLNRARRLLRESLEAYQEGGAA
jgi:RNA polymerase sigma-70 factor (ECF subfamily)